MITYRNNWKLALGAVLFTVLTAGLVSAGGTEEGRSDEQPGVVNVYSHRHYDADQQLFQDFTRQTGITVNVVQAGADQLIERLRAEGENSPADLLITVDAGRLHRATDLGLLQTVESPTLEENVPAHLRHPGGYWYGLTKRARVIVYDKTKTGPGAMDYEDLADPDLPGEILVRSSSSIYNISLLASIINARGEDAAAQWARGVVENMARSPQGNDRDQMKALVAGAGDYALVNTYYVGLLLNSSDPEEQRVGERIGILFPNQSGRGAHVNVSGAGITAHAPNPENALKLLEFLTGEEAQGVFAQVNYEYPVNPRVEPGETISAWGEFIEDTADLKVLGELGPQAIRIFDQAGWR